MYTDEQIMANLRRIYARRSPPFTEAEMRAAIARWTQDAPGTGMAPGDASEREANAPAAPWTKGMNGTAPAAGRPGRPLGSAASTDARAAGPAARLRLRTGGERGAGRRQARAPGGTGGRLRA